LKFVKQLPQLGDLSGSFCISHAPISTSTLGVTANTGAVVDARAIIVLAIVVAIVGIVNL
jgi:site-specific recombinase